LSSSESLSNPGVSDVFMGLSRWRAWAVLSYYDFIGSYRKTKKLASR
jgi:hypothetical protein